MSFSIKSIQNNIENFNKEIDSIKECTNYINECKILDTIPPDYLFKHEEANAHLFMVTEHLNKTIKLIKRTAKLETDEKKLKKLNELIEECDKEYRHVLGTVQELNRNADVKIPKNSQKHISQIMLLAGGTQRDLDKVSELISRRIVVVTQKEKLDTESRPYQRLDHWIEELRGADPANDAFYHNFFVLVNKTKLKNLPITEEEVNGLIEENKKVNNEDIEIYLSQLSKEIELTKTRKILLLQKLEEQVRTAGFDAPENSERLKTELKCFIIYQQIQNNPFDLPLKIDLNASNSIPGKPYTPFNNLQRLLAKPPSITYSKETLEYKNEGLKLIRDQYAFPQGNKEDILISGAGPAGLMYALTYALQGRDFTLIEARSKDDPMRKNIVALGKDDHMHNLDMFMASESLGVNSGGDLKLFDFFGITDDIHVKNQTSVMGSPDYPEAFSVSIENLQQSMMEKLLMLKDQKNREELVQYNTKISEIAAGDDITENARITCATKDSTKTIQPKVVHVCEGYRTTTRDLMGVEMQKQSTAEPMVFSFFDQVERTDIKKAFSSVTKTVKNLPRLMSQLLKYGISQLRKKGQGERNLFSAFGKFELLLQSPAYDYFYATLTLEEKEKLDELKNEMQNIEELWTNEVVHFLQKFDNDKEANALIEKFSGTQRKKWLRDDQERSKVFNELQSFVETVKDNQQKPPLNLDETIEEFEKNVQLLNKDLDRLYKKIAKGQQAHNIYNYFFLDQKISFKKYQETVFADSQIANSKISDLKIGNTRFSLDGDTKTTTDPSSGAGLRTSVLRATLAPELYANPQLAKDIISQSATEWAIELNARSMREEGFYMRDIYAPGTERIERYLDIAVEAKALSKLDSDLLLKLRNEIKQARAAERNQTIELSDFRRRLREAYDSNPLSRTHPSAATSKYNWPNHPKLSASEKKIFKSVLNLAIEGKEIKLSSKQRNTFKSACGKMALARQEDDKAKDKFSYNPDVWFTYLYVYSQHLEARSSEKFAEDPDIF